MNNEPKELKPCAHCGAMAKHTKSGTYIVNHVSGCAIALYLGATNHWLTGPKAIKAWQTRATPDVSEIVDCLDRIYRDALICKNNGATINALVLAERCKHAIYEATKIGGVE